MSKIRPGEVLPALMECKRDSSSHATKVGAAITEKMISDGLALAKKLSKRCMRSRAFRGMEAEDLLSVAYLGLSQAINSFQPAHKVKFTTYAMYRIRGALLDHLRSEVRRNGYYVEGYSSEQVKEVTPETILNALGVDLLKDKNGTVQLAYQEDGDPAENIMRRAKARQLITLVEQLPATQRHVIREIYFRDRDLASIMGERGSKTTAWRVHQAALRSLSGMVAKAA